MVEHGGGLVFGQQIQRRILDSRKPDPYLPGALALVLVDC
jgi:hypothetical protein